MKRVLFSIVIPVYKVEEYLDKCVASAVNQTYADIEIILVDDGSPDRCPEMCDAYTDPRITVIHKNNGGLSDARNYGLKAAAGDYIIFLDSDDYLDLRTCALFAGLLKGRTDIDILAGSAQVISPGDSDTYLNLKRALMPGAMSGQDYLQVKLSAGGFSMAAWLNVYRREFLLANNLLFKVGLLHEDEQWTPRVFLLADSVIETNEPFYKYVRRDNSITTSKDMTKNGLHLYNTIMELRVLYGEINNDTLRKLLMGRLVNQYFTAFYYGSFYRKEYRKYIDIAFLSENANSLRCRMKVWLLALSPSLYWHIKDFCMKGRRR